MKKLFFAGVIAAAATLSTSAFAFHCPLDMAKIDAALAANPSLSSTQIEDIKKLRQHGEKQHKAGDHHGSVDTLAKAMKALGIK